MKENCAMKEQNDDLNQLRKANCTLKDEIEKLLNTLEEA